MKVITGQVRRADSRMKGTLYRASILPPRRQTMKQNKMLMLVGCRQQDEARGIAMMRMDRQELRVLVVVIGTQASKKQRVQPQQGIRRANTPDLTRHKKKRRMRRSATLTTTLPVSRMVTNRPIQAKSKKS